MVKSQGKFLLFILVLLLLSSCSQTKAEKAQNAAALTVEPMTLNTQEKNLISKTGIDFIEYYRLNGKLKKDEDLLIETEKYVNGKKTNEAISAYGQPDNSFRNEILSFGIQSSQEEDQMKLLMGLPGGLSSGREPQNKMTMSTYGSTLVKKVNLKKDTPIYLAAWMGSTKNEMRGLDREDGKLPPAIKEAELAYVYKITLIERKK